MVRGLDRFREHFGDVGDLFVLIGGVAVELLFARAGLAARVTKDIDVVYRVESDDGAFGSRVWQFVRAGGYETRQRDEGGRDLFRFVGPTDRTYPEMLEVFSSAPGGMDVPSDQRVVPVPTAPDASSLSAILMDASYYDLLSSNVDVVDGLPVATPDCLILLKARAWLDLTRRKADGGDVDSRNIKKHRDDVFKLSQLLVTDAPLEVPAGPHRDLCRFLDAFPPGASEWGGVLASARSMGLGRLVPAELDALLRSHFVPRAE